MIFVEHVRLWLPTEGTDLLTSELWKRFCTGCPAGTGAGTPPAAPPPTDLIVSLITSLPVLSCGLTYADLVLGTDEAEGKSLNAEAAPDYCLGNLEQGLGGDGLYRLVMDQQIWTWTSMAPVSVFGLVLHSLAPEKILGVGLFENGPAAFGADGDVIKLTAELPIGCIMPPAPEEVPEP